MSSIHVSGSDLPKDILNGGLPDSRVKNCRETICGPAGIMAKVYCANCGADGGLVTDEWASHIFFICDDCDHKMGEMPGLTKVPDAVVQGIQFDPIWDQAVESALAK